ncbi:tRNA threonylcarbamoyladenosine dehydratase [Marinimicrobium sp. ARAG 43.8]|uniref:tRNA threonylcarbamoyladenosine dehydratase n=1 Tax=Marinimicrobium sp. ARAG 43.8 TaxID=3418719 RepID=UPI003CFAE4D7
MAVTPGYRQRFGALGRLYGESALEWLANAHFAVVGLGGVGSWTAEALARTGIGTLTLIELDGVCVTNTNRQLHALEGFIGASKNQVVSERLKAINPELVLHSQETFLTQDNIDQLIRSQHHVVIDAIDAAHIKARMVSYCSRQKMRLVTVGSSGGKRDPAQITCADLGQTIQDPMLRKVRNLLYRHHGFRKDRHRRFRVDAIFSREPMHFPQLGGGVCVGDKGNRDPDSGVKLDCGGGLGSVLMVTGSFGFAAASQAVERYLQDCAFQDCASTSTSKR